MVEAHSPSLYRKNPYPRCDRHEGSTVPDYSQFAAQCGLRSVRGPFSASGLFPDSRNYDKRPDPWTLQRTQYEGNWCLVTRVDYLVFLATPPARGIPKPDQWKASSDEPTPSAPILSQGEPDKPEQGAAPALSDKEIKALRENGLSVDVIHKQYGIPRDRIKRVNRRYRISPLPRGPKPKTSD